MTAFVFIVWVPYKVVTLFWNNMSAAVSVSVRWFVFSFVRLFVWCQRPFWSSAPSLWTSVGSTAVCAWPKLEPWSRSMSTKPESSTTSSCLRARSPNLLETDRQRERETETQRERAWITIILCLSVGVFVCVCVGGGGGGGGDECVHVFVCSLFVYAWVCVCVSCMCMHMCNHLQCSIKGKWLDQHSSCHTKWVLTGVASTIRICHIGMYLWWSLCTL